jgi:hypothetical protein
VDSTKDTAAVTGQYGITAAAAATDCHCYCIVMAIATPDASIHTLAHTHLNTCVRVPSLSPKTAI